MENLALYLPVLLVVGLAIFYLARRRDYGKPKETDARIKSISVQKNTYLFTLIIDGREETYKTRESYFYNKLKAGQNGRLAYRGRELLDFEPYIN